MLKCERVWFLESVNYDVYVCLDWLFPHGGTVCHKEGQRLRFMDKRGPERNPKCTLARKGEAKKRERRERWWKCNSRKHWKEKELERQGPSLEELQTTETCLWFRAAMETMPTTGPGKQPLSLDTIPWPGFSYKVFQMVIQPVYSPD